MKTDDISTILDSLVDKDPRYAKAAYTFVQESLEHLVKSLSKKEAGHVNGRQLMEGIRKYALDQYGPMTLTLFNQWGIKRSEDFGEIVFNLIDVGIFGKTESDHKTDFSAAYDFKTAFLEPFLPKNKKKKSTE